MKISANKSSAMQLVPAGGMNCKIRQHPLNTALRTIAHSHVDLPSLTLRLTLPHVTICCHSCHVSLHSHHGQSSLWSGPAFTYITFYPHSRQVIPSLTSSLTLIHVRTCLHSRHVLPSLTSRHRRISLASECTPPFSPEECCR